MVGKADVSRTWRSLWRNGRYVGKIGGEGDLAINTVRQVSLSNGQNDYQGATYVQMGTLRTDADGALGNTRELNISNAAIVDLNGSTQTVETFTGQMGSTVCSKRGR